MCSTSLVVIYLVPVVAVMFFFVYFSLLQRSREPPERSKELQAGYYVFIVRDWFSCLLLSVYVVYLMF